MDPRDLKAWREHNKLTQQSAAEALGISRRTLVAYEQRESEIPRAIELACKWLDRNPAEIEPRDRYRFVLNNGGTAGTPDVAIATMSLIKYTLLELVKAKTVSSEMLHIICNGAIEEHTKLPWTQSVSGLIQDTYSDLQKATTPS